MNKRECIENSLENIVYQIKTNGHVGCGICSSRISPSYAREDMLIGLKSHVKQKHSLKFEEFCILMADQDIERDLCKFCKSNEIEMKCSVDQTFNINIKTTGLCSNKECIVKRKQLNTNSIEYVSITHNVSKEDALKIIHGRNKTPFYLSSYKNEESYIKKQREFSKRCKEHYLNKINEVTGKTYTNEEATNEVILHQHNSSLRRKKKFIPYFISNKTGFKEKYGEDIGEEKHRDWIKKQVETRKKNHLGIYSKEWYVLTYGETEGELSYDHREKYLSFLNTNEYWMEVSKWLELNLDYEANTYKGLTQSKIAISMFLSLYNNIKEQIGNNFTEYKIYFFPKTKEKVIKYGRKPYFYDFCVINTNKQMKKIIEFDGDYWHRTLEQKTRDIKKTQVALIFGYDIHRVKESDYRKNDQYVINECMNFLEMGRNA